MLARPAPSGFDIRTLECPEYDHVHQMVVELVDPMKSRRDTFWLLAIDREATGLSAPA